MEDLSMSKSSKATNEDHRHILVVPQLWLIMIDDLLITAFPERWDNKSAGSFEKVLDGIMGNVGTDSSIPAIVHRIVRDSFDFVPTVRVKSDTVLKFTEVFNKEVLRISTRVEEQYMKFKARLGNSDNEFLRTSEVALKCFVDIKDVTEELTMIKKVYEDRCRAWVLMHLADQHKNPHDLDVRAWFNNPALPIKEKLRGIELNCETNGKCETSGKCDAKETVFGSLGSLKKIHSDAHNVFEKASTENAVKSSEQAQYLAWFTIVTVIFTPLSFAVALLALPIESFTPTTSSWTQTQVTKACAGSVVVTILLCVVPTIYIWASRKYDTHRETHRRRHLENDSKRALNSHVYRIFMRYLPATFLVVLSSGLTWLSIH
ncbi:hypothetical protein DHEL01_v202261 [Diaporthe helianthi]|uniref:Uncharacterized protein n=1 Tax=Diaporthe helianthi TaxID=158607 RepID=A0A2P5IA22_DIAHE|nr:hypothetical protein DHEL01_v202261 [Diaporthe helianthi]